MADTIKEYRKREAARRVVNEFDEMIVRSSMRDDGMVFWKHTDRNATSAITYRDIDILAEVINDLREFVIDHPASAPGEE